LRLNRDEVLQAALKLLDKVGLEALTMRRLASALGVQAGAIYWHFANKQALKDAMADAMFADIGHKLPEGDWEARLTALSRSMVAGMMRYRDGARVCVEALHPGPHGLRMAELLLSIFAETEMPLHAQMWAQGVLGYYLLGFAVEMQAAEPVRPQILSIMKSLKKQIKPTEFPLISALDEKLVVEISSQRDAEARFEFGLKVLLNGLKTTPMPRRRK
jgi:TetR/AcrR family tetracycline transcriptional repressor